MKKRIALAALSVVALMAVVAPAANASYTISERQAETNARDAAEDRYGENYGVTADSAACRPQGYSIRQRSYWKRYTWHRWVCFWGGTDWESKEVYGGMRITGHSNGTFGYLPLYGGLRWA